MNNHRSQNMSKKRILFVSEPVTAAHFIRPLVLMRSLKRLGYELHFACAESYRTRVEDDCDQFWPIQAMPSEKFLNNVAIGRPIFDAETLIEHAEEDIELLNKVKPDLVISDMRMSLSVSARKTKRPFATITNAFWSPYRLEKRWPTPDWPFVRIFELKFLAPFSSIIAPIISKLQTGPTNAFRQHFGMQKLTDWLEVAVDADYVFYAESPSLAPTRDLPDNHLYLGPILYSMNMPLPEWWNEPGRNRPLVYLSFGSSGPVQLLPEVIDALLALNVDIVISTAGRQTPSIVHSNVWIADYLPALELCQRSALVVSNGGSLMTQLAIAGNVPVFGLVSNIDQILVMHNLAKTGAGDFLRVSQANSRKLKPLLKEVLYNDRFKKAITSLREEFDRYKAEMRLADFLAKMFAADCG